MIQAKTPLFDFTIGTHRKEVEWRFRNSSGELSQLYQEIVQVDLPFVYESAFITLEHPTDKWWESMFIPLNETGSTGISLTTWGRKRGVNGSCQIKVVDLAEWYKVAHSKIVADKGYFPLSFMGRREGLTTSQRRAFGDVMREDLCIGPGGATVERITAVHNNHPKNPHGMITGTMMAGMLAIPPVFEFFKKLKENGHDLKAEVTGMLPILKKDSEKAMAGGFEAAVRTVFSNPDFQPKYDKKEPEPQEDRSAIYGAWGDFA